MDLGKLVIDPRIRSSWEALDLGIVLARQHWRLLALAWFIPSSIVFVFSTLIFWQYPWLPMLLVWWLKPLWDSVVMVILSRSLFSDSLSVREALFLAFKSMGKEIFAWLSWRRLAPTRSLDLPITLLERLSGKARSARLHILHLRAASAGFWLTIVCVHIEAIIYLGVLSFLPLMVPETIEFDFWSFLVSENRAVTIGTGVLVYISMVVVAPFYVASGFALYISRRIELEGWDIEIAFRRLADRSATVNSIDAGHLPATFTDQEAAVK